MNQIHIISGTIIASIALMLVTTTTMPGQQSAFAHRSHHNHDDVEAQLAIAQLQQLEQVASAATAGAAGSDD